MRNYERVLSHAFTALSTAENGVFRNENILICQDISDKVAGEKSRFKERILICTDERIVFV